ncbi:MAG: hypothetical protein QXS42_01405 [Zestosphaera sp.]
MIVAIPVYRIPQDLVYVYPHFGRTLHFALAEISYKDCRVLEIVENPQRRS